MAPARTKKPKASPTFTATTTRATALTTTKSPARTPIASPSKRVAKMGITALQKQALIDNLQLEVTERARKLRAQYALQAQSLRTRIEMRVNRIPTSLRKATMGELMQKYAQLEATAVAAAVKGSETATGSITSHQESNNPRPLPTKPKTLPPPPSHPRGTKRTSDIFASSDKENSTTTTNFINTANPLPNKKQRTNPTTVLSPKSANSRTLPAPSPSRHAADLGSPQKYTHLQHQPTSPLKPPALPSPNKLRHTGSSSAAAAAAGTTGPDAVPRPKPGPRARKPTTTTKPPRTKQPTHTTNTATTIYDENTTNNRTVSAASTTSTGTTIVKGTAAAAAAQKEKKSGLARGKGKGKGAPKPAAATGAGAGAGRRGAATAVVEEKSGAGAGAGVGVSTGGGGGRRVLRKR